MLIAAAVIAGLFILVVATAAFWVDWWWFGSVGYRQVLTARYLSGLAAFAVGGGLAALFFWLNWRLALHVGQGLGFAGRRSIFATRAGRVVLVGLTVVLAIIVGASTAGHWETWRLFAAGRSFGVADPIYNRDAGFYVFRLPALTLVQQGAVAIVLWTLAVVLVIYAVALGLERLDLANPPRPVRRHVLGLAAIFLVLVAAGYVLANFGILFSRRGFVVAGFTDVTVVRPLNLILAVVSLLAAGLVAANAYQFRLRWLSIAAAVWVVAVALGAFLPAAVQQAIVEPNELSRERPYIANNIALTRAAFDLDRSELRSLSGQGEPPPAALQPDTAVFDNIRLWDYQIARQTFQQIRSFVPYYVFNDVDVDRYAIDGRLEQVLIAARELNVDGLPENAQTWVNRHFAYTHGYGVVVSPISEATAQGLPRFLVGDIPPEGTGPLTIERPEIYFGELPADWVAVNSRQPEITGIAGETTGAPYEGLGRGSVRVSNYLARLILTIRLGDNRILLSNELTPDSRILLRRSIGERARAVAPFLTFDPDPYIVIVDGRLVWVLDAYTATDRFPGATATDGVNYVRHTAKVTVDAYDGTVTVYRTTVPDPIADAYDGIYPDLFTPIDQAPATLRDHFRYPEALFDIQSEVFASYHVTDPGAFYNGEDRWAVAQQARETDGRRDTRLGPMEAYYMTLPLPGETTTGFKLVRPFTPSNRPNMTAWMAGEGDDGGGGRLVVYRFPRQSNIFGPQQVDARINQDPEISAQITLLDQAGSRVLRGNLLVIPIGDTVIYVQPLYLQATAQEGAPTELQFVIVATNDDVEMRPTLAEALAAVAGTEGEPGATPGDQPPAAPASASVVDLADRALAAYKRGQDALTRGDWAAYGEAQAELANLLEQLANAGAGEPTRPQAEAVVPTVAGTPLPE